MEHSRQTLESAVPQNPPFEIVTTAADVRLILCESGWLTPGGDADDAAMQAWCAHAAKLLGPQAAGPRELGKLLSLIFEYDAATLLKGSATQAVMSRAGARAVICKLAELVIDGSEIDSNRFKTIIERLKATLRYRSREMFHPVRLALAGCAGEGDMDRVILLLDSASKLSFDKPVKGTRQRMLEFCTALD